MQEQQYHLRELQNPVVLAELCNENVIANGLVVGTDASRCQDADDHQNCRLWAKRTTSYHIMQKCVLSNPYS